MPAPIPTDRIATTKPAKARLERVKMIDVALLGVSLLTSVVFFGTVTCLTLLPYGTHAADDFIKG